MVLSGCRTAGKFKSLRDQAYEGKLERVLLVYSDDNRAATFGRDFSRRVVSRLADSLARQNVTSEAVPFASADLDQAAPVKAAAARFAPAQILYFHVASIKSSSWIHWTDVNDLPVYSHTVAATLEFSVSDSKTDKTIWRTEALYYVDPRAQDVANAVIAQLRAAHLL